MSDAALTEPRRLGAIRDALATLHPGDLLTIHMRWCCYGDDADTPCTCAPLVVSIGTAPAEVIDHWCAMLEAH